MYQNQGSSHDRGNAAAGTQSCKLVGREPSQGTKFNQNPKNIPESS